MLGNLSAKGPGAENKLRKESIEGSVVGKIQWQFKSTDTAVKEWAGSEAKLMQCPGAEVVYFTRFSSLGRNFYHF